jgi:hypothetical protein
VSLTAVTERHFLSSATTLPPLAVSQLVPLGDRLRFTIGNGVFASNHHLQAISDRQ